MLIVFGLKTAKKVVQAGEISALQHFTPLLHQRGVLLVFNDNKMRSKLATIVLLLFINNLNGQHTNSNVTSIGIKISGIAYESNSLGFSPSIQLKRNSGFNFSIGPLIKYDTNYMTIGFDFSSRFILNRTTGPKPLMDISGQVFKSKLTTQEQENKALLMMGMGCSVPMGKIDFDTSIGLATNVLKNYNGSHGFSWYIKLSFVFSKLYTYKSLIKEKHKANR
ncbi:MAG: hypothetical protein IT243_00800 [Bacteroidia bacterium]|nr:hypothetical protein [Bacteroidia bacterium]